VIWFRKGWKAPDNAFHWVVTAVSKKD
jgi:hypothetical protein